jgi:hypothetical protein
MLTKKIQENVQINDYKYLYEDCKILKYKIIRQRIRERNKKLYGNK